MELMQQWQFTKDHEEPILVDLPHDAMLMEKRSFTTPNGDKTGYYPGGKYTYSKEISLTEEEAKGYVALHFDGVYGKTSVYCNETLVCTHLYGYTPFTADLSKVCRTGSNQIKVIADNTLVPNCRWYTGSGIYRSVELVKKPLDHLKDIRITTVSTNPAVIHVECNVSDAKVTIYKSFSLNECYNEDSDCNKTIITSGTVGDIEIPDAALWDDQHPNLYTALIESETDSQKITFGIRTLQWSSKKGLQVNGHSIKLRGGCIHHDNGVLGACSYKEAELRKVRLLKEAGYNAVRCSHNPCSKEFLEACDELGMYVLEEAFDGWYIPKNYHDYSRIFFDQYENDLKAMIDRDCSHPSVIMYSIGNEITEIADEEGLETFRSLIQTVKENDPTRPVTCGINLMLALMAKNGYGLYKDDKPYEEKELPPLSGDGPKAGSEFFNNLMQKLGALMNWQAKTRKASLILDSVAEEMDITGLNYAGNRYDIDTAAHPSRILLGTETFIEDLPYNWERVMKYDSLIGDFCWTAIDYLGEAGIGAWRYENDNGMPYLAGCGTLDITGIPTGENAFQKVVWDMEDLAIAVRPVHHPREKLIPRRWSFTNAIESWNWKGCDGNPATVEVYSKAYQVELLLNGRSLGKKKTHSCRCVYTCAYEPGILIAKSYDRNGRLLSTKELSSGKGDPHLQIRTENNLLKRGETLGGDKSSLCYLFVEAVDDDGILCPSVEEEITVSVTGDATLLGIGTARPYSDISFGDPTQKLYNGRCQIVVRTNGQVAESTVQVTTSSAKCVLVLT